MSDLKVFSTIGLPDDVSLSRWRRHMADVYFKTEIRSPNNGAVRGDLRIRPVFDLGISCLRSGQYQAVRTAELAKTDRVERFVFVAPINEAIVARQNGKEAHTGRGGLYVLNSALHHEVDIPEDGGMLVAAVPSDVVRSMHPAVDDLCAARGLGDPFLASAFAGLCREFLIHGSAAQTFRLRSIFLNVLDTAIATWGMDVSSCTIGAMSEIVVAKARSTMEENLHRIDYGLTDAAKVLGASRRTLQAAFKSKGTTFSASLLEARLTKARLLLRDPRSRLSRVSSIAALCGFASPAHFATRYRERFGLSPSDERSI